MSLESWIKEFYPVEADTITSRTTAIEHSLRKWKGFRRENMEKHEISGSMGDYKYGSTCALCHLYLSAPGFCKQCPLYQILGKKCYDVGQPYYLQRANEANIEPMIDALEKCVAMEELKANEEANEIPEEVFSQETEKILDKEMTIKQFRGWVQMKGIEKREPEKIEEKKEPHLYWVYRGTRTEINLLMNGYIYNASVRRHSTDKDNRGVARKESFVALMKKMNGFGRDKTEELWLLYRSKCPNDIEPERKYVRVSRAMLDKIRDTIINLCDSDDSYSSNQKIIDYCNRRLDP